MNNVKQSFHTNLHKYGHSNQELIEKNQKSEADLITTYSLLGENNTNSPLAISAEQQKIFAETLKTHNNLFAHVLLDNFSAKTDYEGMQASDSIGYMKILADAYHNKHQNPKTNNLVAKLKNAHFWSENLCSINNESPEKAAIERDSAAEKITGVIKKLESGESFWLAVGYYQSGNGHSMYCQFYKKADDKYDIYIRCKWFS